MGVLAMALAPHYGWKEVAVPIWIVLSCASVAAVGTAYGGWKIIVPLSDVFLERIDNIAIRFAGAVALLFNVLMVEVAMVAIARTVPRHDPGVGR
jgi:phosphate/sulfate permease